MREFFIGTMMVFVEGDEPEPVGPQVCDIPNITIYDLANQDNFLVTPVDRILIQFDYPLNNAIQLEFENTGGFTALDFLRCVHEGYLRIYQEEEAAVGNPGHITGMFNRATSSGPHGIWGHDMEDLVLEGAMEIEPGKFELMIGS
jgi:hypothetical protein